MEAEERLQRFFDRLFAETAQLGGEEISLTTLQGVNLRIAIRRAGKDIRASDIDGDWFDRADGWLLKRADEALAGRPGGPTAAVPVSIETEAGVVRFILQRKISKMGSAHGFRCTDILLKDFKIDGAASVADEGQHHEESLDTDVDFFSDPKSSPRPKSSDSTVVYRGAMGVLDDDTERKSTELRNVAPESHPASTDSNVGAKLLVVEDDPDQRAIIEMLLRSADYDVEIACDGKEALECIKRSTPRLVISDLMMPNMDGIQLVRALKADERYRTIPVLILTVLGDSDKEFTLLNLGVDDYCEKTMQRKILLKRIENLLKRVNP